MISGYFLPHTTPENEIRGLNRRIQILEEAQMETVPGTWRDISNRSALLNYHALREGWLAELERVELEQIAHAARQAEVHQGLADEHARRYRSLLRQRRRVRG